MNHDSQVIVIRLTEDQCGRDVFRFRLNAGFLSVIALWVDEIRHDVRADSTRHWTHTRRWQRTGLNPRDQGPRPDIPADVLDEAKRILSKRVAALAVEPAQRS